MTKRSEEGKGASAWSAETWSAMIANALGLRGERLTPLADTEMKAAVKKVGPPRGGWRRKGPLFVFDLYRIRAWQDAGFSLTQIAKLCGVSRSTIVRRLRGAPGEAETGSLRPPKGL